MGTRSHRHPARFHSDCGTRLADHLRPPEFMPNEPTSPPEPTGPIAAAPADGSVDTGVSTLRHRRAQPSIMPQAGDMLAERYTVETLLGSGTYGCVFSAWDSLRSHRVALKILREANPTALLRFKHEFRALNESSHPNLVRIFKLGRDEGLWFIVMELIEGVPFITPPRVEQFNSEQNRIAEQTTISLNRSDDAPRTQHPHTPPSRDKQVAPLLDVDVAKDRLGQLCQGILALHRLNIVHCDLKPSNVMVTPEGRVVILDFGVSKYTTHVAIHNQDDGTYAGTRPYMAPELRQLDSATTDLDWYATGMMLAEVLTGSRASALANTDYQTLTQIFERAEQQHPEYQDLYTLCAKLLHPNPDERATHHDVLAVCYGPDAEQIEANLGELDETFIGREQELASLHKAYDAFVEGHPTTMIVEGEPGMGKSAFCRTFLRNVMLTKTPPYVLLARCKSDELLGYRAFDEVVDGLTAVLRVIPSDVRTRLLTYCTPTLCALFPTLQTIHPSLQNQSQDTSSSPEDALYDLHRLLVNVADQRRIVIWVDDVQHADRDSLRWIARIFGPGSQPNVFLLLSQSPRGGLHDRPVDIDTLGYAVPRIFIPPFNEQEALAAVMLWLPKELRSNHALVQQILALSSGRPDSLRSMCRSSQHLEHLPQSATLADLIKRRIDELSALEYEVLCAIVVAMSPLEFPLLARITQADPSDLDSALYSLIKNQLIRPASTVADEHYEVWEDAVQQGVLARMPAVEQRALHRRFAEVGASDSTQAMRPSLLVSHLVHAHEFEQAESYAQRLLNASEGSGAWESAAQLHELLIEIQRAQNKRPDTQFILRAIESQTRTGRLQQAADALAELAEHSPKGEAHTLHLRAAETYALCGMREQGRAQSKLASQKARRYGMFTLPAPQIVRVAALRAKIAWRLRRFDPNQVDNTPLDETNTALLKTYRVPGVHVGMSDAILGLEFALHELDLALDLNRRLPIAHALAGFCSFMAGGRGMRPQRAHKWLDIAQELAESANDRTALEWVKACRSTIDYHLGHYDATSEQLNRSYAWLTRHASHQSLILAHLNTFRLVMAISRGNISLLRDIYYGLLADARMRNNQAAEAAFTLIGFSTWFIDDAPQAARAALDRLQFVMPRGVHHIELNHVLWTKSLAELYLYEQNSAAYDTCIQQYGRFERSMILENIDALRHDVRLSQSRLIMAQAKQTGSLSRQDSKRLHRWGNKLSQSLVPLSRGWGYHILAGVHYLEGRPVDAAKYLQRSIDTHRDHGLKLFAEFSYATGISAGLLDRPETRAIGDPYQTLRSMGVVRPERLARSYHPYI